MARVTWPQEDVTQLETDVLVVGGGVAGCLAALEAREAKARVLIADKAKFLERAGSVAGGVDQFMAPINAGEEWDTPAHLMLHVPSLTDGLTDYDVAERAVFELPKVFTKLASIGIDFTDPATGEYFRTRAFGLPGEYHLNFDGSRFKYRIGRHVIGSGAKFLPRTMITDLLVDESGQRVVGGVGFNCRTGERYVIRAKSVVVAAGDVNRLSRNISGLPFDSWHYPYNTGDGHAMAFRVGVEMVNMELVEATLTPHGFSVQGTNSYAGQGAHFLNKDGERFMFKYDPKGEKARRTMLVHGVIEEVLAGNDPIYIDVRHLPAEHLEGFVEALGVDRYTLPGYFAQRGLDIRKELLPIAVTELSIRRGGVYFRGSGLVIDTSAETNVRGLFAAGDASMMSGGISLAAAVGAIAGRGAVDRVMVTGDVEPAPGSIETALERMGRPFTTDGERAWQDFEDEIRTTVTDYVGLRRVAKGMTLALAKMRDLGSVEDELAADSYHSLMRTLESKNIRLAAEVMTQAALAREESRSGAAHRRLDFPEPDNEHWRKMIVVKRSETGGIELDYLTEKATQKSAAAVGGVA